MLYLLAIMLGFVFGMLYNKQRVEELVEACDFWESEYDQLAKEHIRYVKGQEALKCSEDT